MPQGRSPEAYPPNKLWIARQQAGYPQKWVAALLGHRSLSSISQYEHGRTLPDLATALKLEAIYRVPIAQLFPALFAVAERDVERARRRQPFVRRLDEEVGRERTRRAEASADIGLTPSTLPAAIEATACRNPFPHGFSPSPPAPATSA